MGDTEITHDKIWIPSVFEINILHNGSYENAGATYVDRFKHSYDYYRIYSGSHEWLLRTSSGNGKYKIGDNFNISTIGNSTITGIVAGFCLGSQIFNAWDELFSSILNNTYQ